VQGKDLGHGKNAFKSIYTGLGRSRFFMGAKGNAMVWSLNKDQIKGWGVSRPS